MFTPVVIFWCFAVGWALARARTLPQTLLVLVLYAAGSWNYFDEGWRALLVTAGVLALAFVPTLPVPAAAVPLLAAVAGASLWIYLVHWQVFPLITGLGGYAWTWLALAASVAVGVAPTGCGAGSRRGEQRHRAPRCGSAPTSSRWPDRAARWPRSADRS